MFKPTLAAVVLGGFLAGVAGAAPVVNYKILINGFDQSTVSTADLGGNLSNIEVKVQVAVTGEFDGYTTGGLSSNGFHLQDSTGLGAASALKPVVSSGILWDAVAPSGVNQSSKGSIDTGGFDVRAASFNINSGDRETYFETFGGDGIWTTVATGHIAWDGVTPATLSVLHYTSLVIRYDGSTYTASSTGVTGVGDSVAFTAVPEPTSLALIAAGSLLALRRVRKA